MNRLFILALAALLLAGCAHQSRLPMNAAEQSAFNAMQVAPFSSNPVGASLPANWEPLVIFKQKARTQYELIDDQGTTVLHATASDASSAIINRTVIDPLQKPQLEWEWKIAAVFEKPGFYPRNSEDSPARIFIGFDGDKDKLSFVEQIKFETARIITGHDFPYATLMYVWDRSAALDTIADSNRSSRIKTVVVARGEEGFDHWQKFSRNIVADYEKAFQEAPGKIIGIGVITDTDNKDEAVEAWYRDIRFDDPSK